MNCHRPFRINLFSFVDHTGGGVGGGVGGGGGGGGGTGPHHLALCPPLQVPRHWPGSSASTPSTLCACQRGGRRHPKDDGASDEEHRKAPWALLFSQFIGGVGATSIPERGRAVGCQG